MQAVWGRHPATVRDVQIALRPKRILAYTTVMTMMSRLFAKGVLTRTLKSNTHFYEPAVTFSEVRDRAVQDLVRDYFANSEEGLRQFLDGDPLSHAVPAVVLPVAHAPEPGLDETLL